MAEVEKTEKIGAVMRYHGTKTNSNATVTTSVSDVISATEIRGATGFFAIKNTGANSVVVYPRISADGSEWFELDNGSGTTIAASGKYIISWVGTYRFIKLSAATTSGTTTINAYLYYAKA